MLTLFAKKKISEDKVANAFVNSILDVVDNGWKDVAALIDEDPSFLTSPQLQEKSSDKFLVIVLVANLKFLSKHFEKDQEGRIKMYIIEKCSLAFGMDDQELFKVVKDYDAFMCRVNHPSKNVLYSMSKALYHKYNLNEHQEEYFRNMRTPNPLLLKRLNEVMMNFLWDWEVFLNKYKIAS